MYQNGTSCLLKHRPLRPRDVNVGPGSVHVWRMVQARCFLKFFSSPKMSMIVVESLYLIKKKMLHSLLPCISQTYPPVCLINLGQGFVKWALESSCTRPVLFFLSFLLKCLHTSNCSRIGASLARGEGGNVFKILLLS